MKEINRRLQERLKHVSELFVTDANGYKLRQIYLDSFPEGTNPIFKVRRYYECNSCLSFIHHVGPLVDECGVSIFRIGDLPEPFATVFKALADYVEQRKILYPFSADQNWSQEKTVYIDEVTNHTDLWYHLWFDFKADGRFYQRFNSTMLGKIKNDITALGNVLDEFENQINHIEYLYSIMGDLYRGAQYKPVVKELLKLLKDYRGLTTEKMKELFVVNHYNSPVTSIKRSAIYVLLTKYIETHNLRAAEQTYLQTVAPENYRRVQTLASKIELDKAMQTLRDNNLVHSLYRKPATIADIPNDLIIWEKPKDVGDDLFEGIAKKQKDKIPPRDKTIPVSYDELMKLISGAKDIAVLKDSKTSDFVVALSTAKYPDSKPVFKWGSHLGWSFVSGTADASITLRDKVKRVGGNVQAKFRTSLAWFSYDDLDLHLKAPQAEIYFSNPEDDHSRWELDVDANAHESDLRKDPVENIFTDRPEDGTYTLFVHQYRRRTNAWIAKNEFLVEIAFPGKHIVVRFPERLVTNRRITIATFEIKKGKLVKFKIEHPKLELLTETGAQKMIPVEYVINYPTGDGIFFVSANTAELVDKSTEIRGFFVEFLSPSLSQFKRVFEQLGEKTSFKVEPNALTGFGIRKDHPRLGDLIFKIDNKFYHLTKKGNA